MEVSPEILAAARALGQALNNTPEMRDLREAESAVQGDAALRVMECEMMELYNDLITRQRAGQVLSPQEINRFYHLRDRLARHPLVARRDAAAERMKTLFQGAGSAISALLTFDYTTLVLGEQE